MLKNRVIAIIIIRDGGVVQSEGFKHTNIIHYDAYHAVEAFNRWSVDEIILLNASRDSNTKEDFLGIVERVSEVCFTPLTAGGWITSEEYGANLIERGADKLVINTSWKTNPDLPHLLSRRFGRQCIVASIDIKNTANGKHVYIDRGRSKIEYSLLAWAEKCQAGGAGEILINNIDHDGLRKGYDLEAITELSKHLSIPIIAFGGVFDWQHMADGLQAGADAVAAANVFHYKEFAAKQAKKFLIRKGFNIRAGR